MNPTPADRALALRIAQHYPTTVACFAGRVEQDAHLIAEHVEKSYNVVSKTIEELEADLTSAQFWRDHAERTGAVFEQDYLAIWRAIKQPDKTVLESVIALKSHRDRLKLALADAISTFREDDKTTLVSAERQEAWIAAMKGE